MKIISAVVLIFALSNASAQSTTINPVYNELMTFKGQYFLDAFIAWNKLVGVSDSRIGIFASRLESANDQMKTEISNFPFEKLQDPAPLQNLITDILKDSKQGIASMKTLKTDNTLPGTTLPPTNKQLQPVDSIVNHITSSIYNEPACAGPLLPQVISSLKPVVNHVIGAANEIYNEIFNFNYFNNTEPKVAKAERSSQLMGHALNDCGKAADTQSCINGFLAMIPQQFEPYFINAYKVLASEVDSVTSSFNTNASGSADLLANDKVVKDVSQCYGV